MKKVLLATTALVATAGFAAADISLSGSASFGVRHLEDRAASGENNNDTVVDNEIDFDIKASGATDSGVSFGASIDLDNSETDQTEAHGPANDGEVYVSYNGFKVTVGDVGGQTNEGVADVGYQGVGADDLVTQADTGNYDVNVSYAISGISLGVSVGSDTEDTAVSISGEMSGVSFAVSSTDINKAGSTAATAKRQITELALGYTMGAVSINAAYTSTNYDAAGTADLDGYGVSVAYTSGAMTLTAAMSDTDATGQDAAYGVGVAYDLGGGLAVKGGYGRNSSDKASADLGLTMSF